MKLTAREIRLLHVAPRELGVDEGLRRQVQRTIGGAESAKTMDRAGFLAVMAHWEQRGWRHPKFGPWHYRMLLDDRRARLWSKVWALAKALGWCERGTHAAMPRLQGMVRRLTGGRRDALTGCTVAELNDLIEALKAMAKRMPSPGRAHG